MFPWFTVLQGDARYSAENLKIIGDATGQTPEQVRSVPLYAWLPDLAPLPDQLAAYDTPIPPQQYVDPTFADNVAAGSPG